MAHVVWRGIYFDDERNFDDVGGPETGSHSDKELN